MNGQRHYEKPQVLKVNRPLIAEFARKGDVSKLRGRSTQIPEDLTAILRDLYGEEDLLHLSPTIYEDKVKSRDEWSPDEVGNAQFICPAKLRSREGGRVQNNVLARSYVVFETDEFENDFDAQAGLIERLAKELPLRMVVWSGNKSLHAWFDATTPLKDKVQKFYDLAVQLGGDKAVLRPAQLVRAPWGRNEKNNNVQKVLYYG